MAGALKRGLAVLVLCLVLGLVPILGLSGCTRSATPGARTNPATVAKTGSLQEVAPPGAVTQLKAVLDRHQPRVTIQAPADGSLLPPGTWTLEITVRDWPLVDAGSLGLGPHLVVQIDDQAPIRTTVAVPMKGETDKAKVRLNLDPLSPGSHRITAYAARPWGEAVKAPGASSQITVHRVAPTPLTQPSNGEPQLRPVSPPTVGGSEPVLIDWLLWDAPLQHLREDDTRWRLRITVNGDSFQVDRHLPLWLKGFKAGSNAVVLELLDGLGEPIAPTLNTLVQEVIVGPGERPVWNSQALNAEEQAILLGEGPPPSTTPARSDDMATMAAASATVPSSTPPAPAPPARPPARPSALERSPLATPEGSPEKGAVAAVQAGADSPEADRSSIGGDSNDSAGVDRSDAAAGETTPASPASDSGQLPRPSAMDPQSASSAATPLPSRWATPPTTTGASDSAPATGPMEASQPRPSAAPGDAATKEASALIGAADTPDSARQDAASPGPAASSPNATNPGPGKADPPITAARSEQPSPAEASPTTPATTAPTSPEEPPAQIGTPEVGSSQEESSGTDQDAGEPAIGQAAAMPSARSELNPDGSLIRPKKQGLFSGLRRGAA